MTGALDTTALLVIDLQRGLDEPSLGPRNNPECEANVEALLRAWRSAGRPVVFVRHDSADPESPLRPGQPGNEFKAVVSGSPDLLVVKSSSSAFFGRPNLDAWLRARGVGGVAIVGAQTNYCCESTARTAHDLGYRTLFVIDATYTFDLVDLDGGTLAAEDLARVTAATLRDGIAEIATTQELLRPA